MISRNLLLTSLSTIVFLNFSSSRASEWAARVYSGVTPGFAWIQQGDYTYKLHRMGKQRGTIEGTLQIHSKTDTGAESMMRESLQPAFARSTFIRLLAQLDPSNPIIEIAANLGIVLPSKAHL